MESRRKHGISDLATISPFNQNFALWSLVYGVFILSLMIIFLPLEKDTSSYGIGAPSGLTCDKPCALHFHLHIRILDASSTPKGGLLLFRHQNLKNHLPISCIGSPGT